MRQDYSDKDPPPTPPSTSGMAKFCLAYLSIFKRGQITGTLPESPINPTPKKGALYLGDLATAALAYEGTRRALQATNDGRVPAKTVAFLVSLASLPAVNKLSYKCSRVIPDKWELQTRENAPEPEWSTRTLGR